MTAIESRGSLFFKLIMNRPDWIHRRVETITFLPEGATKRRISYDFTVPESLASEVKGGRVGIPITQMKKVTLSNLNVTDAATVSLSIWDTEDTGMIGFEVLGSALSGFLGRDITEDESRRVRNIVFSKSITNVEPDIVDLERMLKEVPDRLAADVASVMALINELAQNFIFVVEVPVEYVGARHLLKISYDQDLDRDDTFEDSFYLRVIFHIEGQYFPNAGSFHLEINAPEGLQIFNLSHSTSEHDIDKWVLTENSKVIGHIAHINVRESMIVRSRFTLELRPTYSGLIFQTLVGLSLGWIFLSMQLVGIGKMFSLLDKASEAGPIATISLAIPAFLLTQIARSREHTHVQRILRKPRVIACISSGVLFLSAASLVLDFSHRTFLYILLGLWISQSVLWFWMYIYRKDLKTLV